MVNHEKPWMLGTILLLATTTFGCLEEQGDYPAAPIRPEALPPPQPDGAKAPLEGSPQPAANPAPKPAAQPPPQQPAQEHREGTVVLKGKLVAVGDLSLDGKTIQIDVSGYGDKGGGYFGSTFLTQPGPFELRAPKNAGPAHFTVFVGDPGTPPTERLTCIFDPFDIGAKDIDGFELKVDRDKLVPLKEQPEGKPPQAQPSESPPAAGSPGPGPGGDKPTGADDKSPPPGTATDTSSQPSPDQATPDNAR